VLDVLHSVSRHCGCGGCCDCGGCSSELYWSEWHNDPPQCCDPCDCHGNWIGPAAGYRAPYAHPYAPTAGAYAKGNGSVQPSAQVARQPKAESSRTYQR
jgi:hypothetical protein